jgi:hypothetical protein
MKRPMIPYGRGEPYEGLESLSGGAVRWFAHPREDRSRRRRFL